MYVRSRVGTFLDVSLSPVNVLVIFHLPFEPLKPVLACCVEDLPQIVVRKYLVCPVDFLEVVSCRLVARVLVWMVLHAQSTKRFLDLAGRCTLRHL